MKKLLIVVGMMFLFATAVVAGSKFKKAKTGVLDEGLLIAYGSSSAHPDHYSGRVWEGYGEIEGIGQATVRISACWDWNGAEIYTADHHGALMVTTPQDHEDTKDDTPFNGDFECEETVTITDKKGDTLMGAIMGGSVYELEVFGWHESVNEWLISFSIVDGTGKYSDATGTGSYRMIWESGSGSDVEFADGGYVDPARFHEQEIFLHLN